MSDERTGSAFNWRRAFDITTANDAPLVHAPGNRHWMSPPENPISTYSKAAKAADGALVRRSAGSAVPGPARSNNERPLTK
ncbi:MAG: hypothetical protein H3C38_14570 [Rhodospirillales bacterium]|nr:hypothetical protein [Rhodospirillales bacterium]